MPNSRHLIAIWVQNHAVKLRRLGSSFEEIALELTQAGQGKGTIITTALGPRQLVELPAGVTLPPGYRISARGALKAYRRARATRVELRLGELRGLVLERLETLYLAVQGGVARGSSDAVRAALAVLRDFMRASGLEPGIIREERPPLDEEEELKALIRFLSVDERIQYITLLETAERRMTEAKERVRSDVALPEPPTVDASAVEVEVLDDGGQDET